MIFRIDLKIFLFLVLFYITRQIEIYSIIMIFAIIHEFSHVLAGIFLKMKVKKITLMPLGLSVEFGLNQNDYNDKILKSNKLEIKRIIVALAGPMVNLLIIFITKCLNINIALKQIIIYSNLIIVILNLLPIYPLDGGRIIKSFLSLLISKTKANIYINRISNICLFIITCIFSILIYYLKNIALLFIIMYLWYIVCKENKIFKMKQKLYKTLEIDELITK